MRVCQCFRERHRIGESQTPFKTYEHCAVSVATVSRDDRQRDKGRATQLPHRRTEKYTRTEQTYQSTQFTTASIHQLGIPANTKELLEMAIDNLVRSAMRGLRLSLLNTVLGRPSQHRDSDRFGREIITAHGRRNGTEHETRKSVHSNKFVRISIDRGSTDIEEGGIFVIRLAD